MDACEIDVSFLFNIDVFDMQFLSPSHPVTQSMAFWVVDQ